MKWGYARSGQVEQGFGVARGGLVSILGLIIARHFLQLDAFARASDAEIARVARPWITTGADPAPGRHS